MIDLCAVCVAAVYDQERTPTQVQETGGAAELIHAMTPDLVRRFEAGEVRIWTPYGYLPLLAVTTVAGTRLCGHCAARHLADGRVSRVWR